MKKDKTQSVKSAAKNVIMTIDMGGSKTKIVVQSLSDNSPQVLLMDSQLADVGKLSLDSVPTDGRNSDRAWVGFASNNDDNEYIYYAVGALARNRFGGLPQLHELKYELALPKILAAIWLARAELALPSKFNLFLSVLLPSGEMSDKDILKSRIIKAATTFETPDGKLNIKLAACEVSSEGSGIYTYRKSVLGDKFYDRRQLYVMLGFRNASAFVVRGGVVEPGITSDFGMYWMLDLLATRVSGLDKNNPVTSEIIANSVHSPELLKKLSRKRSQQDIDTDFESITTAVTITKDEYVRAVVRWLKSVGGEFDVNAVCPQDEIVFCGGTAEYLRGELDKHYASTELVWHGGVSVPSEFESKLGGYRLADVWSLHEAFSSLVISKLNGITSKKRSAADSNAGSNSTYQSVVPSIGSGGNSDKSVGMFEYKRVERPSGTMPPIVN